MVSFKSILALATLTVSALAAPAPIPGDRPILVPLPLPSPSALFNGTGQVRTRYWRGEYEDLGCLTKEGRWTTNEALCGVFKADRSRPEGYGLDVWKLTTKAGPCRLYGAEFICESGFEGFEFGAWPWSTAIPGVECLRWGQYGVMAGYNNNPPLKEDTAEKIHLVGYYEPGKYVWLTWSPL